MQGCVRVSEEQANDEISPHSVGPHDGGYVRCSRSRLGDTSAAAGRTPYSAAGPAPLFYGVHSAFAPLTSSLIHLHNATSRQLYTAQNKQITRAESAAFSDTDESESTRHTGQRPGVLTAASWPRHRPAPRAGPPAP